MKAIAFRWNHASHSAVEDNIATNIDYIYQHEVPERSDKKYSTIKIYAHYAICILLELNANEDACVSSHCVLAVLVWS